MSPSVVTTFPSVAARGARVLSLTGLRFEATLGVLDHEKIKPQKIAVDAELNLGMQSLAPAGDNIVNVLDYRIVRRIIIDECTCEHVHLLETLIAKVAQKLLRLPEVIGVRMKISKLEIFQDCEVAIRTEVGSW